MKSAEDVALSKPPGLLGRAGRLLFALIAWFLLWKGAFHEGPKLLELQGIHGLQTKVDLSTLQSGDRFMLEGVVFSEEANPKRIDGRFIYQRLVSSRTEWGWTTLLRESLKPKVAFHLADGKLLIPEESYSLDDAPPAPDDPWHHFNQHNRGFKIGDPALAMGRINAAGTPVVESLTTGPREAYEKQLKRAFRIRTWLANGFRVFLSLMILSIAQPAFRRSPASRIPVK